MADIFIIGCGYIGTLVAHGMSKDNRSVAALARSADSEAKLQAIGITPWRGDLDDPTSLTDLPLEKSTLYYFAPPPASGVIDTRMHNFIQALGQYPILPAQIIYLSTTGVYGDTGGAWVSEANPLQPQTARAKRRVDAEETLRRFCMSQGVPLTILRTAGIYGPGKLPIRRLKERSPVLREEESGYTNRIHEEDLATICLRAATTGRETPYRVYNVSDGHPGTMSGYLIAVADALRLPRPHAVTMAEAKEVMSPAMLSYLSESRRLDNSKLLNELGIVLKYPTLEAGLRVLDTPQS